ncbi:MAG: hypothetical protein M1830_009373 [Pleopsidium flavum]|nr:MAG: hypothetical protein M1830_009373 [Pleopsidium flavum]
MASFLRSSRLPSFFQRAPLRPTLYKIGALLTWVPMYIWFNDHIAQIMWVTGPSMYPFLNTDYNVSTRKQPVLVNMRNPAGGLKRGMIVSFWSPQHPELMAVKRIVALEGDTVVTRAPYTIPQTQVPFGHVWVEGDHPEYERNTLDSNTYGPVGSNLYVKFRMYGPWPKQAEYDGKTIEEARES